MHMQTFTYTYVHIRSIQAHLLAYLTLLLRPSSKKSTADYICELTRPIGAHHRLLAQFTGYEKQLAVFKHATI